jgi:Ala-tRNA(Pro) deacylase
MPARKLKQFLDENSIKYVTISHSPAFTSQEVAASAHVRGQELAKTVMVKLDGVMAMVVLPATRQVDFAAIRDVSGAKRVELAGEDEFRDLFPECEPGAMPPFGNLYGMKVLVVDSLAGDDEIAFNAGSHTELIRMRYEDFERLVNPEMVPVSV